MEKTSQDLGLILQYFTEFSDKQIEQFRGLKDIYTEWNEKINVISRKDIDKIYLHHVLHSLSIAAVCDFLPDTKVIDIGCGGGFPGVPLAIFFPEVKFHLVDSIAKKLKVVTAVCETLNIHNITIQHIRAEEIKNRKFDFAVSRAVAPLKDLWWWSKPLIKGGFKHELANGLICLKGGDLAQEVFESGVKPNVVPVNQLFQNEYFDEKFILHVKK